MIASFHPLARIELWEAFGYYEQQAAGLGVEFVLSHKNDDVHAAPVPLGEQGAAVAVR